MTSQASLTVLAKGTGRALISATVSYYEKMKPAVGAPLIIIEPVLRVNQPDRGEVKIPLCCCVWPAIPVFKCC